MNQYIELLEQDKIPVELLDGNYVYALWKDDEIVYIGKTNHLQRRVKTHQSNKDFDEYSYFECENYLEMDSLESALILELKPRYNKMLGSGFESLRRLRERIRKINDDYKYDPRYYVNRIRDKLEETDIEIVDFKGSSSIRTQDVSRALKYLLEEAYE